MTGGPHAGARPVPSSCLGTCLGHGAWSHGSGLVPKTPLLPGRASRPGVKLGARAPRWEGGFRGGPSMRLGPFPAPAVGGSPALCLRAFSCDPRITEPTQRAGLGWRRREEQPRRPSSAPGTGCGQRPGQRVKWGGHPVTEQGLGLPGPLLPPDAQWEETGRRGEAWPPSWPPAGCGRPLGPTPGWCTFRPPPSPSTPHPCA